MVKYLVNLTGGVSWLFVLRGTGPEGHCQSLRGSLVSLKSLKSLLVHWRLWEAQPRAGPGETPARRTRKALPKVTRAVGVERRCPGRVGPVGRGDRAGGLVTQASSTLGVNGLRMNPRVSRSSPDSAIDMGHSVYACLHLYEAKSRPLPTSSLKNHRGGAPGGSVG